MKESKKNKEVNEINYKKDDNSEMLVLEEPQIALFEEDSIVNKKEPKLVDIPSNNKIRVFETFAGYGGASFGLKRAKIQHEIVGYSEIDKFASELYDTNFPNIKNFGDITKIDPKDIPDFDLFTGGFPCQPFSQVGLGKGEQDTRGTLFHKILEICEVKRPKHILLENVKGLITKSMLRPFFQQQIYIN